MLFFLTIAIIFIIGTFLLLKTKKFERHFILFLIKTKFFLSLIEGIAGISHRLWKLFADFAIIFSFSGLGAAYLSKYRNFSRNLDVILFILGSFLIFSFFSSETSILILFLFICLIFLAIILEKIKNQKIDFLVFSLVISLIWLKIFSILMQIGITGNISSSLVLMLIVLTAGIFGIPGLLILSFLYQSYLIVFQNLNVPGISPFIPATEGGEVGLAAPGTGVFIPIWYALIAIIIAIIFHEFAHGILARVHNIKLKSTGILTLGIFPIGAFVEPDEEELEKKESLEKMRVFSVGSFSNFIVAIISFFLLLFSSLILGPLIGDGITVIETHEDYPAHEVLNRGAVIYEVNSISTQKVNEFKDAMKKVKPGEEVALKTNAGEINLTSVKNPNKPNEAYIGIVLMQHIPNYISQTLFWIFFINLSISLVNLLPIIPLDGGRMLKELVLAFNLREVTTSRILYGVITFLLLLIIINIFPLFGMAFDFLVKLF